MTASKQCIDKINYRKEFKTIFNSQNVATHVCYYNYSNDKYYAVAVTNKILVLLYF